VTDRLARHAELLGDAFLRQALARREGAIDEGRQKEIVNAIDQAE
jgi:hypothetical protein